MKKYLIGILILVFSIILVMAGKPDLTQELVNVGPSDGRATVTIPANAKEVAPGIFSLGTAIDNGRVVEGYAIIDYKKAPAKPTGCNDDGKCQGWEDADCSDCTDGGEDPVPTSSCYGFLAKGAKWKTVEDYVVDTTNSDGLSDSFVRANLASNIGLWEAAAGYDILGDENQTKIVNRETIGELNGQNEVIFANVGSPGAIAVTIVWGIWRGPPSGREIVEWDQVYDDFDFNWTEDALVEPTKMDFRNIAIHELGHSFGLDDLYTADCSEETMYGYGTEGETKKRDLNAGDITGIKKLYS